MNKRGSLTSPGLMLSSPTRPDPVGARDSRQRWGVPASADANPAGTSGIDARSANR
jgi:hypothetical protein